MTRRRLDIPFGISGAACHLPAARASAESLWQADSERIERLRSEVRLSPKLKQMTDFGIREVPDAQGQAPWELALSAAHAALDEAGTEPAGVDLIVDFSTTDPGGNGVQVGNRVQAELGAAEARVLALGSGACASLHGALLAAVALMRNDQRLATALLVGGDCVHPDARVLFPLTVLGDGGSALVLRAGHDRNVLLGTELKSAGLLHGAVGLPPPSAPTAVNIAEFERRLLAAHLKAVHDVVHTLLERCGLDVSDVDLLVPPNMSETDQDGYVKVLGIPRERTARFALPDTGHLFGSDGVNNWCRAREQGRLASGALVLLVAAGAGFGWGASLFRI